jgi:hypothetical protein
MEQAGQSKMGPIEISFIILIIIFGVVGVVRGFGRELGVTVLLLLGLFVLLFLNQQFVALRDQVFALVAGPNAMNQQVARAIVYTIFLTLIVFVSYQGETLVFPTSGRSPTFSLLTGLLNGYLFAGTVWYYMAQANWPLIRVTEPFSNFYHAALRLLPPAILDWRFVIAMVTVLLILRVWR